MKLAKASSSVAERGRPRDPRIDEVLLRTARRHLFEYGYAAASIDSIAREAEVSKAAIYRRWSSKAELLADACASLRDLTFPEPTGSLERDLVAVLEAFRRGMEEPNGMPLIGTLLAEEFRVPELIEVFRRRLIPQRRKMLGAVLSRAREEGRIRADSDIDMVVTLLIGSYYAAYLTAEGVPEDWGSRAVRTVLRGVELEGR